MRFIKTLWQLSLITSTLMATGCVSQAANKNAAAPDVMNEKASGQLTGNTIESAKVPTNPFITSAMQKAFDDANAALKAGRSDEAERNYHVLIAAEPKLAGPHANLGLIYRNANKLDASSKELNLAVQLSPKQAVYWNQLGVTYRQLGQFDKAHAAYDKAIALDANYADAILNLGILVDMYQGDPARAMALYTRYLALTPNGDPAVTKWIAELKNRKPVASTTPKDKS